MSCIASEGVKGSRADENARRWGFLHVHQHGVLQRRKPGNRLVTSYHIIPIPTLYNAEPVYACLSTRRVRMSRCPAERP